MFATVLFNFLVVFHCFNFFMEQEKVLEGCFTYVAVGRGLLIFEFGATEKKYVEML